MQHLRALPLVAKGRHVTLDNHALSDVPAVINPRELAFLMPFTVLSDIGRFTVDAVNGRLLFNFN